MKFKDILPFEEYVIKTNLSIEQVNASLKENIEPKSKSIFSAFTRNTTKPYQGIIYGNGFTISRIISYKNSFLPVISGHIFTFKHLTTIKIKMAPNKAILVLWYLIVIVVGFGITTFSKLFNGTGDKNTFPFGGNEHFIFIALFLVVPLFAFKIESRKSKRFLASLFEKND